MTVCPTIKVWCSLGLVDTTQKGIPILLNNKERIIQEFVPGKQVTLAHLIAHPMEDLSKKIGVPGAEAIGILTLTPGETAMIAADIATKAASVQIGFLDRFTGAVVLYGSVGSVEEGLKQVVSTLSRLLGYATCEITRT